jgi:hypothetical protein
MERLTERDAHGNWRIKRFTEILPAHWQACNRLAAIEDILGDGTDEYDLDRLRELAQAHKENRVLPEGSGWFVTCSGKKLTVVMDIEAALRREQDG